MTSEEAIRRLETLIDFSDGLDISALKMAIKVLEQTRWIPVSERLPEEEGYYFVTFFSDEWHSVGVCGFHKYDEGKMVWDIDNIIAWMSLPELYKTENEDKE